ncbi:MAG: hypothetical protein L6V84_01390 [Oscillospiraceae bacterium]|nr:MAG: hypothetical protein L6V84_01390 [Oscillospiraceae bacterium]
MRSIWAKIDTICESVVVGRKAPDSDAIILTAVVFPCLRQVPDRCERGADPGIHPELHQCHEPPPARLQAGQGGGIPADGI